jgi:hypothetical protein
MQTNMNNTFDVMIDECVAKSLLKSTGMSNKTAAKYTIVPLAQYLHPDYDPFKQLEAELMVLTLRKKYGITE